MDQFFDYIDEHILFVMGVILPLIAGLFIFLIYWFSYRKSGQYVAVSYRRVAKRLGWQYQKEDVEDTLLRHLKTYGVADTQWKEYVDQIIQGREGNVHITAALYTYQVGGGYYNDQRYATTYDFAYFWRGATFFLLENLDWDLPGLLVSVLDKKPELLAVETPAAEAFWNDYQDHFSDYEGWAFSCLGHAVCCFHYGQITGAKLRDPIPSLIRLAELIAQEISYPPSAIGYPLQVPKLPIMDSHS